MHPPEQSDGLAHACNWSATPSSAFTNARLQSSDFEEKIPILQPSITLQTETVAVCTISFLAKTDLKSNTSVHSAIRQS